MDSAHSSATAEADEPARPHLAQVAETRRGGNQEFTFLEKRFIRPGTFIAAVGADSAEKHELEASLLAENKVVVDLLDQCARIGELRHALQHEVMTVEDVYGELGEVIAGVKPGRTSSDEIIIFNSTGMGLQDVITATIIYEKAVKNGIGSVMEFAE